jgi:hypothetical protein
MLLFVYSPPTKNSAVDSLCHTGDKTLHVVAIASSGDLKRWENFY